MQRPRGNQQIRDRVSELHKRQVFISVISMGELIRGVAMLTDEDRKRRLTTWLAELDARYADQILPIDLEISQIWGDLTGAAAKRGHTVPATDGLIAATARRHGLYVMTRNVRHFRESGVEIVNPWES
jgi:predicted nucleic acid-binding protein